MFEMNEEFFAELQKDNCWFTFAMLEDLPEIDPKDYLMSDKVYKNDVLFQRHIFALMFGSYGYSKDLKRAARACALKIIDFENHEPKNRSFDNPEFTTWLNKYAQYCVLLGTITTYQHDYKRAALYLMNGLKTGAINLCMPYCDFINYVLKKLEELPIKLAEYSGCGFSVDDPMGGLDLNDGVLIPSAAEMVIPALEGVNGGLVLAYNGRNRYGSIKRLGSTSSKNFKNCIDIYEVLIADSNHDIKRLRLYFNGYFTNENRDKIRLPNGYKLDFCNPAAKFYKGIK